MRNILFVLIIFLPAFLLAQISEGGFPLSDQMVGNRGSFSVISLATPDQGQMESEPYSGSEPLPLRVGIPISREIDLMKEGSLSYTSKGDKIVRLGIRSQDALGLILYYRHFSLPEGSRLFIYSKDKAQLIGAFTHKNNPSGGYFATEMIRGEELIVEYNAPATIHTMPEIVIYEVHYIYRGIPDNLKGSSGPCEVNVNCAEGAGWQNEKKSVAKIFLRDGGGTYLCTGTLINNARQDSTPYFLTARHCGSNATANHYSQWIFYFNYESPACEDPPQDPPAGTIVGCELISQAPDGTFNGSDFKLLKLDQRVPDAFNPWFSGWSVSGQTSPSGVGIHHPQGDIKKISTYNIQLTAVDYSSSIPNPDGDYWRVIWAETENGHGVTEGGSSGSPIFDNTGKIVGTLTGGAASCTNLTSPDYYGRLSKHWESNGSAVTDQLKPWLDPDQSGLTTLDGFGYGNLLSAGFSADTSRISVGGSVQFTDLSTGTPNEWEWTFYGGEPSAYNGQTPGRITYMQYGEYHVALVIRTNALQDSILKRKFIRVTPNLYPVPARDHVILDFGNRQLQYIEVDLIDMFGKLVKSYKTSNVYDGIWQIPIEDVAAGTYLIRVKTDVMEDFLKLSVY